MEKIRFTTLHPAGTNVDLTKDEGQIPYTLAHNKKLDTTIVACHIDINTANVDSVKGLKIHHVPLLINNALTGIIYLLFNSKKIDWLNIYFAGRQAYLWMRIYKALNRSGRVYLKLDMDFRGCDLYDNNTKERTVFNKNTEIADIISVESIAVKNRIQKYSNKELLLIEDGISKLEFSPTTNQTREDVFLTVGRLGTYQKATDVLLTAFERSATFHNWKLKLIGTVEDEFNDYIECFFEKYPDMRQRIIFTGPIYSRELLYEEYCRAKVFVLPSRWESFGISSGEALCCGCHLILSDSIPPATEMTNNEKYGEIVETGNIDALSNALIRTTQRDYRQDEINDIVDYAVSLFSWDRICDKLYNEMNNVMSEGKNENIS